jgi:hypothetical protein
MTVLYSLSGDKSWRLQTVTLGHNWGQSNPPRYGGGDYCAPRWAQHHLPTRTSACLTGLRTPMPLSVLVFTWALTLSELALGAGNVVGYGPLYAGSCEYHHM